MSAHSPSTKDTLLLTVDNMGFMLDRLGADCAPLQFLRELTQNSIEAILRTKDKTGEIRWDVDWNRFDLTGDGVFKLAVIDNGDGMTGPEMVNFINKLSSSIQRQSLHGNYGIGAKIAAATRNHVGLIYLSWKDSVGAMIHLWRDPESGQYGLRQFPLKNGDYGYWLPIEDSLRPEAIREHGTMVVLLGNGDDEDTVKARATAPSPSRWIAKYLNTRFFRFPDGIAVRAREGWENPRSDNDRNLVRTVTGQHAYLKQHSESSGFVRLSNGVARWWVLRDENAIGQNSGWINSGGHTGALFKDELYEVDPGRAGVAKLQQFGVILGYNRVVIYVEPQTTGDQALTTNTARTQLLVGNEPLPWSEWAAEFREKMPNEISEVIATAAAKSASQDHSETIKERLKQISELFRLSRYRPTPSGSFLISDDVPRRGGGAAQEELERRSQKSSRSGSRGGKAGDIYAIFATETGQPASKVKADPFPDVMWISAKDETRAAGHLEDRAAGYLSEQNLLQINADFRVFGDMVDRFCKMYADTPGARNAIVEVVREWFEQSLVEAVLGVQSLEGAREWSTRDMEKALSPEALSVAVMPRYHLDFAIKRALGSKLGTAKQKAG